MIWKMGKYIMKEVYRTILSTGVCGLKGNYR